MRLDEFLRGDLTGERLPTTWVSSHQLVYQADDGGLLALDTFNNSLTVLVTNHTLVSIVFYKTFLMNKDLRGIVIFLYYGFISRRYLIESVKKSLSIVLLDVDKTRIFQLTF